MAGSARFAGVGGQGELLSVRFQANTLLALTDRMTGYFRGGAFQHAISEVNLTAAIKVQEGMVEQLNRKIKERPGGMRPQREGQRLQAALMDERNRDWNASGYWVLRRSWMDASPVELYWRRIEEGDEQTFNSTILFTTDFTSFYGPYSGNGTIGTYSSVQGRQRPRVNEMPAGFPHMRMPQHMLRGAYVFDIGPFPAHHFTQGGRTAMERFDMLGAYERALKGIGLSLQEVRR